MAAKRTQRAETPEADDQQNTALQPAVSSQLSVTTEERFKELIEDLKKQREIVNDSGKSVKFTDDDKLVFIPLCERAFPILRNMIQSIHDVASLLGDVRQALKPMGLFIAWLDVTGFPRRTAYNYLKLHDTFREELPAFSYLGMKKLMAASTLKEGMSFVKENEKELLRKPVTEVEAWIKDQKHRTKKGKGGRKPKFEQIGSFKVRTSTDGTKVIIENLDDDTREKLLAAINEVLSQVN